MRLLPSNWFFHLTDSHIDTTSSSPDSSSPSESRRPNQTLDPNTQICPTTIYLVTIIAPRLLHSTTQSTPPHNRRRQSLWLCEELKRRVILWGAEAWSVEVLSSKVWKFLPLWSSSFLFWFLFKTPFVLFEISQIKLGLLLIFQKWYHFLRSPNVKYVCSGIGLIDWMNSGIPSVSYLYVGIFEFVSWCKNLPD